MKSPRAQHKIETACCQAKHHPFQPFHAVRISCAGSVLPCRSSAEAANASSLALTCKAAISDVEHESEVHVSVILLSILLFLSVTILLSLALLLLLHLGVLCLANTRNHACLIVLCQKTNSASFLPHQLPEELPAKVTTGKATSLLSAPQQLTTCLFRQVLLFAQQVQAAPTITASCVHW